MQHCVWLFSNSSLCLELRLVVLGRFGSEVLPALEDAHLSVRRCAVEALGRLKLPRQAGLRERQVRPAARAGAGHGFLILRRVWMDEIHFAPPKKP